MIDPSLATRLAGLAGFRNLLVHEDASIVPERVLQLLDARLGDFAEFADAIERWAARERERAGTSTAADEPSADE